MTQRKFDKSRAYKLVKILVIGITTITGLYGFYVLYLLQSDSILKSWEETCKNYPDTTNFSCMGVGLDQINEMQNLMDKSLVIAFFLPIIFFGGSALYRYLFPKSEKNKIPL